MVKKHDLQPAQAQGISGSLIPNILQKLVKKTNDPGDSSFDLQGILKSLTGGGAGGMDIQGLIAKFTGGGLDKNKDGKVDLKDLGAALGR